MRRPFGLAGKDEVFGDYPTKKAYNNIVSL